MKKLFHRVPAALLLVVLLLSLAGFGPARAAEPTGEGFVIPDLHDLPDVDLSEPRFMLANAYNSVGLEYALPQYADLGGQGIDAAVRDDTRAMIAAAHEDGVHIYVGVAYRNWDYMTYYYEEAVLRYGTEEAWRHFLPPGCNEHQTGYAIDVTDNPNDNCNYYPYDDSSVYESPVYDWMMEHCAEYGFIFRYPAGKEAWYGVGCDHFHFRYVGQEAAAYIMEHDLCLEEFMYLIDPHSLFVPGLNSYATF